MSTSSEMNDYCNGIAYATGYIATENGKSFLCVRNLDEWYPKCIEAISNNKAYESVYNRERDGKPQWVIKARDIECMHSLSEIRSVSDFCRAYIEIHGILDMAAVRNRKGEYYKKPRLRIYGNEYILDFLNASLPAAPKKIQHIRNTVGGIYTGQTCALYYQSAQEITDILHWIDGDPKNEKIWAGWNALIRKNSPER